ncbi:hypothetical protein [Falsiroseomonas oryziterrae]|uniref:hypothetical protein n=1 Tax=Falsiroseomonas oryziterrae TaxID=2911368 RepID=UPI001F3142FE|nr:hypothetical protein [Roseomonas sp. NPKOSM-4]
MIESRARQGHIRHMMYLLSIVVPPLAIMLQGRPFQAIFNGLLWLGSLLFILLPFVAGQVGWLVAVIWAVALTYNRRQEARDRRLIDEAVRRDRQIRA